ncbi:unnamed protein product [Bemisia tabaci]|uniref:Exocyst complex component 3 n=1 Tax=Bemisia tabaci TaxID=7038 RepID=A0A9P0A9Z1_BEMTA|nr:PREDICTED: exocyst complex component 3 [Bemisia tabaci]CAH0387252.1 unnamed protein product [Bemisia tabaci]
MCLKDQEKEARSLAVKYAVNILQRPGQLEKVSQYKKRTYLKKLSNEAVLKTAMQSQLDGVIVGMNQLDAALRNLVDVRENLQGIEELLRPLPALGPKLQDVKEKNMRHSQYVTAIENLKHLFTVPESVQKAKQWINEGKFLHAHQSLMDLENSRDDLLFELYKLPNQAPADQVLLKAYFEDVEDVSQSLGKQLKLVLSRTLNTVRKEPTVIVTALRIIEREEKADAFCLQRQKQSGFLPPGRPKAWKEMAMEVFEKSVATRIEGTQVDERSSNKMWLVMYLEFTRQLILEDLRVVKTLCGPCFPPWYNIIDKFVFMYHNCLSKHLEEIIAQGLKGNEYVSILSWTINTYPGSELMRHPELNIDTSTMGPLLRPAIIEQLQCSYLEYMENNYVEWMQKTLETEKQDWSAGGTQETGADGAFYTAAPVIVFQMIDQNLQVTNTISPELTHRALILSMEQVIKYGNMYRGAIIEFKKKHFEDRSQMPYFTNLMITIVNNCLQFVELAEQMASHYWRKDTHNSQAKMKHDALVKTFQDLRCEAAQFLLEEAFLDLESHFQDLITQKWVSSSIPIDTICVTLEDYFQDYSHLHPKNLEYVVQIAEDLVVQKYITAMLQRKITFKTYEERKAAALKMAKEVEQLQFFTHISPNKSKRTESPLNAIIALSEVLKSEDPEILSLDLLTLLNKYPDITEDHLARLLSLRGDLSRSDIREKISYALKQRNITEISLKRSIFHQVRL